MNFKDFLESESNLIGNQSNMRLVGNTTKQAATDLALDAVAGLAGPVGSVAKSIASAIWNNRKNIQNKINDDQTFQKVKSIISTRFIAKQYQKAGMSLDEIVTSFIGATDESQSYLSDQEKEVVKQEMIKAVNNETITYGFTQNLINELLKEKINQIQAVIQSSKPKNANEFLSRLRSRT